ncbi:MAG: radical SAM protein, partial [Anaerolineae bacterium]|nr:radical SAM protein [Anaerolineae bacterium]
MLVLSTPIFAYIELTSQCNNHCPGCGNVFAGNRDSSPLPVDQWHRILHKLRPHLLHLCLTGGEPTLYPEFEEILGLICQLDIPFSLFTNARWHNPERVTRLLRNSPGLVEIFVSLHGPDSKSHDAFTGVVGSFQETCENIRRAVTAALSVSTNTIITRLNFNRVDEVLQLGQDLGASSITFSRYIT